MTGFLGFLWFHLGASRGKFVAGMAMTFLEGVATAVPPLAVGLGLARLAAGGAAPADMIPYGIAVVLATLLRMVLIRLAWGWGFEAGNVATQAIRNRIVEHMRRTPLGILRRWSPARLATLITEDGRWLNEVSVFTLSRMFAGAATTLALLAAIAWFDWLTASAVAAAFLLGLGTIPVAARLLKRLIERRNAHIAEATHRIGEYADGIAVFRTFGLTGPALTQLHTAVTQLHDLMRKGSPKLVALQQAGAGAISLAAPFAIILVAGLASVQFVMPEPGALIPALFLALATKNALFAGVVKQMIPLRLGLQAHSGIAAFLAEPAFTGTGTAFVQPLDVRVSNVAFGYDPDNKPAIEGVSFEAKQGGVTAIVGPSGAGKSTVIALLMRFFDTDKGEILIGGQDVRSADPTKLQSLVSLVNQDVHLFHDTLRANILLGDPSAGEDRLRHVVEAARLEELVAALPDGLDTMLGDTGRTLSGGERQRVAVARALLKDAPVIVLDEATSAMDPLTERAIQQAIGALERGRTVIVVAHRLRTIAGADRIVVIDRGRVVEDGRHDDLAARDGLYRTLWQAQERAAGWRLR